MVYKYSNKGNIIRNARDIQEVIVDWKQPTAEAIVKLALNS